MLADTVAVHCPACSRTWTVTRRADGTYPATARCAMGRGGCGRTGIKVPRGTSPPRSVALSPAAAAAPWEPPSEPRGFARTGGTCPDCHAPVMTEPRGTTLWCSGCKSAVTPPAVLAPYQRGAQVTRAAKSQRERDLEALALARRKGAMGAQLAALADDERLTPDSAAVVAWFAEQVKAAASGARLDELVELFADAGIRRRRFWQGKPAALTAGYDEDQADEPAPPRPALAAVPAVPHQMTWAEAIAASGLRVAPHLSGCQLTEHGLQCSGWPGRHIGSAWICGPHYEALAAVINDYNRQQRTA